MEDKFYGGYSFLTDVLTGIGVILIFGSVVLVLGIVLFLNKKDFFVKPTPLTAFIPPHNNTPPLAARVTLYAKGVGLIPRPSRWGYGVGFIREILYLIFTSFLFAGLLVQFTTICGVIEQRV